MATKRSTTVKKKQKKNSLLTILSNRRVTALLFVVLFGGLGSWLLFRSDAVTAINPYDKAAVESAYKTMWAANTSVSSGWTGNTQYCSSGNITDAARIAQVRAVNYVRLLNGLDPIVAPALGSAAQLSVQRAALMMEANAAVSHTPPTTWKCYSKDGATTAGKSNLIYSASTLSPVQAIKLYMNDGGNSNIYVGHRRWLLNPETSIMSFGMTTHAAATQVVGLGSGNSDGPRWTSWPSDGYFPAPLEPNGRWSFSTHNSAVDFSQARVRVTKDGTSVPISLYPVDRNPADSIDHNYGKPTLVWQMPSSFPKSGVYHVFVSNIHVTGLSTAYDNDYYVRFFTPSP